MAALYLPSFHDVNGLRSKSTDTELLNLRPVRALLMMEMHHAATIIEACKYLELQGRRLTVDSILDALNNSDFLTLMGNKNKEINTDHHSAINVYHSFPNNNEKNYEINEGSDVSDCTAKVRSLTLKNNTNKELETDSHSQKNCKESNKTNHQSSNMNRRKIDTDSYSTSNVYHSFPNSLNDEKDGDFNDGSNVSDGAKKSAILNELKNKLETDGKGSNVDSNILKNSAYKTQIEIDNMTKENERLRKARLCRKCGKHQADIILLPCRHVSVCHNCWDPKVKASCPQCKTDVAGMFHVFWG